MKTPEVRPIDANALYEELRYIAKQYDRDNRKTCTFEDCIEFLENLIYVTPTIDVVPMDFFEKCLDEEIKKRIQTERTNRQILENYVPIRHGRWVKLKGVMVPENAGRYTCSECGSYALSDRIGREKLSPYCPYCGAIMERM